MILLFHMNERGFLAGLHDHGVRIGILRQSDIQPAAFAFFIEPVFPVRIIQVMGFIFQVIPVMPGDETGFRASKISFKANPLFFSIKTLNIRWIRRSVHPAKLGPCHGAHVQILWPRQIFGVNTQNKLLAFFIFHGHVEILPAPLIVPRPPFTFHVLGI